MKPYTQSKVPVNGIHYCEAMLQDPKDLGGLEQYDGSCRNKAKNCVDGVHLCGVHSSSFTKIEYNERG